MNALKVTPFMWALRLRTGGFPLLRISSLGFDVEIFAAPPASIGTTNTRKGTRRAVSSLAKGVRMLDASDCCTCLAWSKCLSAGGCCKHSYALLERGAEGDLAAEVSDAVLRL